VEERKTIFDYLAQIMIVFGFSMLVLNIFCLLFGDSAKDFSAMFELGKQGVPVKIAFQYLCLSAAVAGIRFLFFTDVWIKKIPIWLRTIGMLASVLILIIAFILLFDWFPVDMWQPWAMFFLCFGISFVGSCLVMMAKERAENRKMNEALERLKEKEKSQDE